MNDMQLGFVFYPENCIQCHGCEGACKMWRATEQRVKWRRVMNIWHGEYPNVTCSSVSLSCLHCSEPACVSACPTNALTKRDTDGTVLFNRVKCTGCQVCLRACPYDVPQFGIDGMLQKCDMCQSDREGSANPAAYVPPCILTCPTHALELKRMTSSQKKEAERSFSVLMSSNN